MKLIRQRWLAAILVALGIPCFAAAQDRTALVVANFDYGEHQLSQVKTDASTVGAALRHEGFRVTMAENVPYKELKNTVEQFARNTVTRGTAVFYFAGLAGQYQTYNSKGAWWNHLQGAGKPADLRSPERDSLALADVVKLFADHSTSTMNLLVLDIAEPNPFLAERAKHPLGLASMDANEFPDDVAVLLSSQSATATAGTASFAAAFSKQLPSGRESLRQFLASVSDDVQQKSGGKQLPSIVGGQRLEAISWRVAAAGAFLDSDSVRIGDRPGQHWINSAGMVFCWCPPGKFVMGRHEPGQTEFADAEPVEVTLSHGFWMGKYEVTQSEGTRLKQSYQSSFPGKHLPQHSLQHGQVSKLLSALNDAERKSGMLPDNWEYALPTEAEWEYACRAGTTTRYSFGDDARQLFRFANYADKRLLVDDGAMQFADSRFDDGVGRSLAVVGSYLPNAWGLHDMHGNVAEWCADHYLSRLVGGTDPLVNQKAFKEATDGVIRGGAWCSTPAYCESGFRNSDTNERNFIGFRIVLRKK